MARQSRGGRAHESGRASSGSAKNTYSASRPGKKTEHRPSASVSPDTTISAAPYQTTPPARAAFGSCFLSGTETAGRPSAQRIATGSGLAGGCVNGARGLHNTTRESRNRQVEPHGRLLTDGQLDCCGLR